MSDLPPGFPGRPLPGGPPGLFTGSTISRDDTKGAEARERNILAMSHPQRAREPPHMPPAGQFPPGYQPRPSQIDSYDEYFLAEAHQKIEGQQPQASDPTFGSFDTGEFVPEDVLEGDGTSWRQDLVSRRTATGSKTLQEQSNQPENQSQHEETRGSPVKPGNCTNNPSLALALGSLADEYLKLDVIDDGSDVTRYISFLLDTIGSLQSRLHFRQNFKNGLQSKDQEAANNQSTEEESGYKVLHRIFCGLSHHEHDGKVYEDVPIVKNIFGKRGTAEEILSAKVEIRNIDNYLRAQPEIHFLVFEEHRCGLNDWLNNILQREKGSERRRPITEEMFDTARGEISPRRERMKIASQLLASSLKMVAECKLDEISFEDCDDDASWEMEAPYNFFFHHRKKLQEFASCDPIRGHPVKILLDYLETKFGTEFAGADDEFMRGVVTETSVEKLFKPNQMVVSENDKGVTNAYILGEWPVKKANQLLFSGWHWRWAYGGRQLERQPWYSKIDLVPFKGNVERPLSKLQVVPAQYADEKLLTMLQQRGEKFWSLRNQSFVSYNGWDQNHDYFYSKERFMIDMSTYSKLHPRPPPFSHAVPDEISDFDDNPRVIRQDEDLDERQVMILPAHTYGYSLREKKWVSLSIDQTESIVWNKKAFDRLVLQPDTKRLLRALINVRMSNTKKMDDLVSGKGNGLIMLLHGSPGTGKSLTAESVAEYAEKPLYRVTCGDIGTIPMAVEKYLETVLYLGKIWDCVLLLDEADVFLEERTVSDLTRNSLVSIFLRVLEYYEGIIILTSNRVGTFDEAFQSRIRVALHYEPLTKRFRKAIWSNFFEMLTEDQDDINVDIRNMEGRLEELADYKMNGRQIRNIVLTARQLAMEEGESLEWKHLSQVLTLSRKFNEYLEKVKGHSNEDWAVSQQIR